MWRRTLFYVKKWLGKRLKKLLFLSLLFSNVVFAQDPPRFVAIVIDDLGNDLAMGKQLVALPYDLTYSFLPRTKYSLNLVAFAQEKNKEIMLHLPMQAINNKKMGLGGLSMSMLQQQFVNTVKDDLQAVPGAIGVNNHMGSLLTQQPLRMQWLMMELKANKNLYFLDSRTHANSIAAAQAKAHRIPMAIRDVFLDHVVDNHEIDVQFARLLKQVSRVGHALAIGHPHSETLVALKKWLPKLKAEGVEIVTVSRYISLIEMKHALWQASLSRPPKVAKN